MLFYSRGMLLRCNRRLKDGKSHDYWSVTENRRPADGRVVQRRLLYLGEINASQREAWCKMIEIHDEGSGPAFPVVVFGGERADVRFGEACGAALAEIIAGRNLPAVIGVSELTMGALVFTYAGPEEEEGPVAAGWHDPQLTS